jgi:hypothetical protein
VSLLHWGENAESTRSSPLAKVLAFSAIAEIATGFGLVVVPAFVVTNLLAPVTSTLVIPVARVAGVALVALGLACWSGWNRVADGAFRALLTYNLLVAAYLAFLGTARHLGGVLLWPTVALHALVTALLLFLWKAETSRPGS